jgi:hypothetical protein
MESSNRICKNCGNAFVIEPDDLGFYEKIKVPPPTFCPQCRKQRRLTWRNDLSLYSRNCDLCKKSIVSIYSQDKPFPVYCQKCWWSDAWDPQSYGVDFDFSKNFFVQFRELQDKVPALAMVNDNGIASVNCEYTQDFAFGKNCYMVFIAWKIEEGMYSHYMTGGREIVDSVNSWGECEYIYESINTEKCYQCKFIYESVALADSAFCYDCRDCSDCFMCVGLRHKQYYFKNQPCGKEEYEKILEGYRLETFSGTQRARQEFEPMLQRYPRKFATLRNCVNCTGDQLINGKNSKFCFDVQRPEDCRWIENSDTPKDSYDLSIGGEVNQCYEAITPDQSFRNIFSIFSWKNTDVAYVEGCHSSKNLFGCCGLKKSQYCILNRQYSKEEHQVLVAKIKESMGKEPYVDTRGIPYRFGEFFPAELSHFAYNETVAQNHFPLSRDDAISRNLGWQENFQMTVGKETIKPEDMPDSIHDAKDSIVDDILSCIKCARNYRITPQELKFYRRMTIPLPRRCFYCRHAARFSLLNPHKLWKRSCQCAGKSSENSVYKNTSAHFHAESSCPNEFETSYPPERPEIVYCEQCYNSEIV